MNLFSLALLVVSLLVADGQSTGPYTGHQCAGVYNFDILYPSTLSPMIDAGIKNVTEMLYFKIPW